MNARRRSTGDFASALPELSRETRRRLAALARRAHVKAVAFDFESLIGLARAIGRDRRSRGLPAERLRSARARAALLRQAALLRAAVELRMAGDPMARLCTAPAERPPTEAEWSARAARELDRVLLEEAPLDPTFLACALLPPADWVSASALARALRRIDPGVVSSLVQARARFAAGEREVAEAQYRGLLVEGDVHHVLGALHESAGCAAESRGAAVEALDHMWHAASVGAGVRSELGGLALALARDERGMSFSFAERLELALERPAELARAAREVSLRWELADRFEAWSTAAVTSASWRELAQASRALHGRLDGMLFARARLVH